MTLERGFILLVPEAGTYGRGDANFDAALNFDDLLTLAANCIWSLSGSAAGSWAAAQVSVPEPTMTFVSTSAAAASLSRRRHRPVSRTRAAAC